VVFVFAKTADDALASLAKEIDKLVAANQEKKLAAVINFVGEANDAAKAKIKDFGEKHNLKNVALTLTTEAKTFQIGDEAVVTVMHYKDKTVRFNAAVAKGGLKKEAVAAIIEGAKKILE
jgi:hypothetical protein